MNQSLDNSLNTLHALNAIMIRRARKVILPKRGEGQLGAQLPQEHIGTMLTNLRALGFGFTPELYEAVRHLSEAQLVTLYKQLVPVLRDMVGANQSFEPMYPDFPEQVMQASDAELYINAMMHYMGDALGLRILPDYEAKPRPELLDTLELRPLDLGALKDAKTIARNLIGAKTSISGEDRGDLATLIGLFADDVDELLPQEILHKENLSTLTALLMEHQVPALDRVLGQYFKTATDVLRLAVALSDGDVSLAAPTKFISFKRPVRRLLLALLERCKSPLEDMVRWRGRWVRLGERLHPGEMKSKFPKSAEAFDVIRNKRKVITFAHKVEKALGEGNLLDAVNLLETRPGDFARRLDHVLRLAKPDKELQHQIVTRFDAVAPNVATTVLMQVRTHFDLRDDGASLRTFFPKGNVAKLISVENKLPSLPVEVRLRLVEVCDAHLVAAFSKLEGLGKVYLDDSLKDYLVPFSQRSASKALRTLVRGSHLPMPKEGGDTIRFFLWWKEGEMPQGKHTGRVDIDLSAVMYNKDWSYMEHISYTNLRSSKYRAAHSGDITSAPNGACEFIDLDIPSVVRHGGRYVLMNVYAYTNHPYCNLPECYAGWMMRQEPKSGEIFEPATVLDKVDLAADTRVCIPVVLDLVEREVIWADLALRSRPAFHVNIESNERSVAQMGHAITTLKKPTLHTLFALHAEARAEEIVTDRAEATTVFAVDDEATVGPFDIEQIMANYL